MDHNGSVYLVDSGNFSPEAHPPVLKNRLDELGADFHGVTGESIQAKEIQKGEETNRQDAVDHIPAVNRFAAELPVRMQRTEISGQARELKDHVPGNDEQYLR